MREDYRWRAVMRRDKAEPRPPIRFRYIALLVRETIPLATTDTRTTRIQLAATVPG